MVSYRKSIKHKANDKTMAELIAEAQTNFEDEDALKSLVKWRDLKDNFDPLKATLKYKAQENKMKFTERFGQMVYQNKKPIVKKRPQKR